jgi:hypothetical protein
MWQWSAPNIPTHPHPYLPLNPKLSSLPLPPPYSPPWHPRRPPALLAAAAHPLGCSHGDVSYGFDQGGPRAASKARHGKRRAGAVLLADNDLTRGALLVASISFPALRRDLSSHSPPLRGLLRSVTCRRHHCRRRYSPITTLGQWHIQVLPFNSLLQFPRITVFSSSPHQLTPSPSC